VYCQILHLRGCLPGHIQHALTELPETLDETYERTLRGINHANWEFAHRLFQWVSVASRPLRVEELAELLAFDFKAGPIPRFHEDWRLEDPVHTVLSTCSSLLAIVNIEGSPVIHFSHSSVKDFLTSTRLAETSDIIIRRYHISMIPAHALAAQVCLGILLHLDENITKDCLPKIPLAKYAARHWLDHARFKNVLPTVDPGMKLLFDPNKAHLAAWLWIYDPTSVWHVNKRGERPSRPNGTSLHYAAFFGFHTMVKHLITEHSQDVNACGLHKMSTPLHWASSKGHVKVVRYLLEHGANVTAQCEDGSMPLHWAARKGRLEVILVLLRHKADAKAQDKNKSTPLHQASSRGYADSARVFLEHGVDAIAQDKNGWTPLHCAAFEGHVEVTRVLLEHGVDTTAQDRGGRSPLHHASFEGNLEVTRVFLEHGVDATAQDKNGRTPVHRASFRGHVETVRLLLEGGADIKVQDKNGQTPLHHASLAGHLEVARVLLEHGADPAIKSKDGQTPSSAARRGGHFEIIRIISRYEGDVGTQAGDDAPNVWTKCDWESKADVEVEGRIGSRVGDPFLKQGVVGHRIIPRKGTNGASSSGSSGAGTSTMWSLHTARTTLGQPSTRSKESRVVSVSSYKSSNDASMSGDARVPLNAGISETVRIPHLHAERTRVVPMRHHEDEKLNTRREMRLSLSPLLVNSEDITAPAQPLDDTLSPSASANSVIEIDVSDNGSIAQPTLPSPLSPSPAATDAVDPLLSADQVEDDVLSTPVTPERPSRIPRSQSADPDKPAHVSHVYTKSANSVGVSGTETASASASASATKDGSSVDTSRERRVRKKRSKSAIKERVSRKVQVSDFEMMRVLGKGCAGKVLLVRHKNNSGLYALKAITKRHVLAHQELQHTLTEQAVLRRMAAEGKDPFVVKLWWSFHDKENLFLVMVRVIWMHMTCVQVF